MDELIEWFSQFLQEVQEVADQLSEEEAEEISQFIQSVIQFIDRYQSEQQQGPAVAPVNFDIPEGEHLSSNVEGFAYDPEKGEMKVQFHGPFPHAKGPVYAYSGVPESVFDIIRKGAIPPRTSGSNKYHTWHKNKTPSHGASVNALLKNGNFAFRRVS